MSWSKGLVFQQKFLQESAWHPTSRCVACLTNKSCKFSSSKFSFFLQKYKKKIQQGMDPDTCEEDFDLELELAFGDGPSAASSDSTPSSPLDTTHQLPQPQLEVQAPPQPQALQLCNESVVGLAPMPLHPANLLPLSAMIANLLAIQAPSMDQSVTNTLLLNALTNPFCANPATAVPAKQLWQYLVNVLGPQGSSVASSDPFSVNNNSIVPTPSPRTSGDLACFLSVDGQCSVLYESPFLGTGSGQSNANEFSLESANCDA
jgi:hypothetical protein